LKWQLSFIPDGLYSPECEKGNSQKSICRIVHRAPVRRRMRQLLTLRAQTSDHYISCTGIKMRLSQYASSHQDADAAEG